MALADTGDGERKQKGFAVFGTPEYMAPEQVAGETGRRALRYLRARLRALRARHRHASVRGLAGRRDGQAASRSSRSVRAAARLTPSSRASSRASSSRRSPSRRTIASPSALALREALEQALVAPDRRRARARRLVGAAVLASIALLAAAGLKDRVHSRFMATREPVAVATLTVAELPNADANATRTRAANANATRERERDRERGACRSRHRARSCTRRRARPRSRPRARARSRARSRARCAAAEPKPPATREARQDDHSRDGLLVRASARSVDKPEDSRDAKVRLADARSVAREHATDAHALKAWAIAAMHAGRDPRGAPRRRDLGGSRRERGAPPLPRLGARVESDASARHAPSSRSGSRTIPTRPTRSACSRVSAQRPSP